MEQTQSLRYSSRLCVTSKEKRNVRVSGWTDEPVDTGYYYFQNRLRDRDRTLLQSKWQLAFMLLCPFSMMREHTGKDVWRRREKRILNISQSSHGIKPFPLTQLLNHTFHTCSVCCWYRYTKNSLMNALIFISNICSFSDISFITIKNEIKPLG